MISSTPRTRRNGKHNYSPFGVSYGFDLDAETKLPKELIGSFYGILKRCTSDDLSGELIGDAQHKVSAIFIRNCHAVFVQPLPIEAVLCFLKLQRLPF